MKSIAWTSAQLLSHQGSRILNSSRNSLKPLSLESRVMTNKSRFRSRHTWIDANVEEEDESGHESKKQETLDESDKRSMR